MNSDDPRIAVLQQRITETKMHPTERDALADDLKYAADINGDTAPVMQMMKTMFIQNVRRELLAISRADTHYKNCLVANQITEDEDGHKVMPWSRMIEEHIEKQHSGEDKAEADAKVSSMSIGKWVTIRGPVVRVAVICLFTLGGVWLMLNRNDATLRKDMTEKIIPSIIKAVKDSKETDNKTTMLHNDYE